MARVAFGLKAHSGWAALVAVSEDPAAHSLRVVDRRRLELADPAERSWAGQPYHAAAGLEPVHAEALVRRATEAARDHAARALASALAERRQAGDAVAGCALLLGTGMPAWSVAEVLAVHFRMHKAEGELFREALAEAARGSGLGLMGVREKQLEALAGAALRLPAPERARRLAEAGKQAGPPWARDQKQAALAAWIALRGGNG